jgi:hypothetical protein
VQETQKNVRRAAFHFKVMVTASHRPRIGPSFDFSGIQRRAFAQGVGTWSHAELRLSPATDNLKTTGRMRNVFAFAINIQWSADLEN